MKTGVPGSKGLAGRLIAATSRLSLCGLLLSQLAATPGWALTCPYPKRDVERIFMSHHSRPGTYFLAYGIFSPDGPVPPFDETTQSRPPFSARFDGHVLQRGNVDQPARFDLTVKSSCLDANCGAVPTGPAPALIFIRDAGGIYSFAANSCNDSLLFDPAEGELRRALDCLDRGGCMVQQ